MLAFSKPSLPILFKFKTMYQITSKNQNYGSGLNEPSFLFFKTHFQSNMIYISELNLGSI